ncbi:transposase (fragment) [Nitrosomonas mobilis]|uniref:Mutator family transposase n=1 Tax=Nitrosomonas mobilis TaxID=51642 RepID=A0A1G5SIE6_9PROT
MTDSKVFNLNKPEQNDPLQEVLREGTRKMLSAAIEAEVTSFIHHHGGLKTAEGRSAVVRNGYLPGRSIQTGLGDIEVKVPKVRDRSGSGIKFNSSLIPPYLKRTRSIEEFLPWLYLRGVSTGDFTETLKHLLGTDAPGLSPATISRLKQDWEQDYQNWTRRDLSGKRYAYVWADGIYSTVRMDDRLCLLVIIGSDETGRKELLALSDGYRESEASWTEVLMDLKQRGLKGAPKLAIGDGALGFWKAVTQCWPDTDQQHC